jgi:hypothetical protein
LYLRTATDVNANVSAYDFRLNAIRRKEKDSTPGLMAHACN